MTPRDNLLPPNPRNDAVAILHAGSKSSVDSPVEYQSCAARPARLLKTLQVAALVCLLAGLSFLLARDEAFLIAGAVGYVTSVVALFAGMRITWRRFRGRRNALIGQTHRGLKWSALALLLFAVNSWGCLLCNMRMRECTIGVVSTANLRGIGQAALMYLEKYESPARTLDELARTDFCSAKQIVSPFDRHDSPTTGPSSSYVFVQEAASDTKDPTRVLTYERVARCAKDIALFPERFHVVLYCDGHVELLRPSELSAALKVH